jgi:hypothetical protein
LPHSEIFALQHSDLNAFLHANVGTEQNDMTLRVMSVLARLGMDPWTEAERLANLPIEEAVGSLTGAVSAALRGAPSMSRPDVESVARRLISLLPDRTAGGGAQVLLGRGVAYQRIAVWILMASGTLLAANLLAKVVIEGHRACVQDGDGEPNFNHHRR